MDEPDARGGNQEAVAEALCSASAVLGNIPENLKRDYFELLLENILRDGHSVCPVFTFEFLPDMTSAVVTFQSGNGTCPCYFFCVSAIFLLFLLSVWLPNVLLFFSLPSQRPPISWQDALKTQG